MIRFGVLLISVFVAIKSMASENAACSEQSTNAALVVVDMQPFFANRGGYLDDPENRKMFDLLIKEQIQAIKKAREAKIPVIFLEYDIKASYIRDKTALETESSLKVALQGYKDVAFFKKDTDGMFDDESRSKADLVSFLQRKKIGTLIVTGASGGSCVQESIKGALKENCSVVAYSRGIVDFNYENFIYPYVGLPRTIKPNCKSCSFKEVWEIEDVVSVMAGSRRTQESRGDAGLQ